MENKNNLNNFINVELFTMKQINLTNSFFF